MPNVDIRGKYALDSSIGYITQILTQQMADRLIRKMRKKGVEMDIDEWIALVHIHHYEKQNQNQLVKATNRNKTAVTRLVNELERKGWVRRVEDKNDRRNNHIMLTVEGNDVYEKAVVLAEDTTEDALNNISAEEYKTWREITQKILENAKEYDPDGKY
jgi:DNA-binding MarR family transcriptional regulator